MIGWIGNGFIIVGAWLIGDKKRYAFLFSIVGELIWIWHSLAIGMYDLAAICLVFTVLAVRNWFKWAEGPV